MPGFALRCALLSGCLVGVAACTLKEARGAGGDGHTAPPVPAIDTDAVFKSLPGPKLEDSEPYHFKEIRVPSRPNETEIPFPPAAELTAPAPIPTDLGPLRVIRQQPTGAQQIVGTVSATFNQPMVPLASLEDLKDRVVPLQIEPLVAGRFRWLGTSTVEFEPVNRMPFSTLYTAQVPEGTKSATGKSLSAGVSWTFETPRVQVSYSPVDGLTEATPDQLIQLTFNQAVNPESVRDALQCRTNKSDGVVKLVKSQPEKDDFKDDTSADTAVRRKLYYERNVFLRPATPFPLDAAIACTLPKGFTGAEGPLPTQSDHHVQFHTYAPFQLKSISCTWGQCRPEGGIQAAFNNTLGEEQEVTALIHLKPEVADFSASAHGSYLYISGDFQPSTRYHVVIDSRIQDTHHQHLDGEAIGDVSFAKAEPDVILSGGTPFAILESVGPRVIPIHSTNVSHATLTWYRIEPDNFTSSLRKVQEVRAPNRGLFDDLKPEGHLELDLGKLANKDKATGLSVDGMTGAHRPGMFIVDLNVPELAVDRWHASHRAMVVVVSDLGMTAHLTEEKAVVLVSSLSKGRPVPGAKVWLMTESGQTVVEAETNSEGIAELKAWSPQVGHSLTLAASRDEDQTVAPIDGFRSGEWISTYFNGLSQSHPPTVVASAFTDRQPYKPGETVHVAGVVEVATHGVNRAVEPLPSTAQLQYTVFDSRGQRTHEGKTSVGVYGLFSVDLALPSNAFLGDYSFNGMLEEAGAVTGQSVETVFSVEEYRTPEYQVSVDTADSAHFVGENLQANVHGEYFFGGAMSGASAQWSITRSKASFTPPRNSGFTFGDSAHAEPFVGRHGRRGRYDVQDAFAKGEGTLDANGRFAVHARLEAGDFEGPVSFQIQASVTDANRQTINANTTVLAHAGEWYPGLKLDHSVVKEGQSIKVSAVTADIAGKRQAPPSGLELLEEKWVRVKHPSADTPWPYESEDTPVGGCDFKWSHVADEPATCDLQIPKAGNYVLRVHAKDPLGRENVTAITVWAYGKGWSPWYRQGTEQSVELVADQPEYAPGETAHVLIRSPFPKSVGILAVDREGLVEYRALDFEGSAHGEEIRLTEAEIPNVHLTVSLVRGRISPEDAGAPEGDPDDAGRPMYAAGSIELPISLQRHTLKVAVTTAKAAIEPGSKLTLQVHTATSDGTPEPARLVIAVVDEGVLSLLGYSIPNPLTSIFAQRPGEGGDVSDLPLVLQREARHTRVSQVSPRGHGTARHKAKSAADGVRWGGPYAVDEKLARGMFAFALATPPPAANTGIFIGPEGSAPVMAARTFFASTAYFSAEQSTDARGDLTLNVPMPENLTRYRIMVVAAGVGERFGEGDGSVEVRKPVLIRPALPRFLNIGDKFLASAVINNQTAQDLWIDAQAKAANGTVDAHRQRVLVPAGQAREVAFDATAGVPGTSRWQFAAVALAPERWNDAAELSVPVELPATVEAFATYGTADKSVLQPLELPKDALPDFGGLEVSMSSTALTGLTDAVTYLNDYPYECVEQTSSRILPYIVLRKIIGDFYPKAAGTQAQRDELITKGLESIWSKERQDGGFGYWADSRESYLFVSAWAGYVLARAKSAGYAVDEHRLTRLEAFLNARLRSPRHDFGEDTDYNSQAMTALVVGMLGDKVPALVQLIYKHREQLAIFGKAWLMEAAHTSLGADSDEERELNREIQSTAVQEASSAHFAEATTESIRLLMHSNDRTDAIVLDAFVHVRPKDPLIPKIIHGLQQSRVHGHWDTTQSNAWATLAFSDYYDVFEKETPDFDANIFMGNGFVGQGVFSGRETKVLTEKVPFSAMAEQKKSDLILEKSGAGRLYYRLGLRYAPKSLKLAPEEQGFTVRRTYLPMADDPGSVFADSDGTVRIKAGSEVRVKLEIVVPDRAEFVAVDDPLPAGLEAVNTMFRTNQSSPLEEASQPGALRTGSWWGWWWSPFNHTELRDDRVALFADSLSAGVYTHTYVARATTKGTFQVPPARAFEMYEPENFGRTASAVVEVR
jgi:uncharacterized protein YfaS (alpha-2-macroglobulin family)